MRELIRGKNLHTKDELDRDFLSRQFIFFQENFRYFRDVCAANAKYPSCGDRDALNSILILILAEKIHSHTVISHPMRSENTCQHIMQSVFFSHSIYQGVKTKCLFNYPIDTMNPPT